MHRTSEHRGQRWALASSVPLLAGLCVATPVTAAAAGEQTPAVVRPAHDAPAPRGQCSGSLATATLMPFSEHLNHAHFGRSPQQQASDIQDADTYVKVHTVLVESMTQPGRDDLFAISDGSLTPFVEHMDHAHFERSPQQQAQDIADTDQYVKFHTVLVEHMLQPTLIAVSGDC